VKILIINGPNMNLLGLRSPKHYGILTLNELNELLRNTFKQINFTFFQSNHEGLIVDQIQLATSYDAIIINPAAFTHYSIAIRDALEICRIPKVEVHLSNLDQREGFRQVNLIKDVCDRTIMGLKENSYIEAVNYLIKEKRHND